MKKLLLLLCLLLPAFVRGEEVKISLDMSYDKAIELLQKCGAEDITARKQPAARSAGLYWWLNRQDLQVAIGEHYGKVNRLSYWLRRDVEISKTHEDENERSVRSLTLNPEKSEFSADQIFGAQESQKLPDRWSIRVEILVVAMPQEKALALLPDLRDEAKIEGAYTQIMELLQRKEAKLIGYPIVHARNGEKATSESILEKIYPTQYQPPQIPQNFGTTSTTVSTTTTTTASPADDIQKLFNNAFPTNFEKRNMGVTLEVDVNVRSGGKLIDVILQPQHVALEGFDSYEAARGPGVIAKVEQPQFYTTKTSTSVLMKNGQRLLIGMHQLNEPGQTELHILQASAVQVGD